MNNMILITRYSDFILNETLKTHNIDLTIDNIKNELILNRIKFDISKKDNTICLKLLDVRYINGIGYYLDILNNLLIDRHGWFPSKMEITGFGGMKNIFPYNEDILRDINKTRYYEDVNITYEPKYDKLITDIPTKLYHLSIQEYMNKVSKIGLVPKSKSKLSIHLDRFYLCSDPNDCFKLISQMKFYYRELRMNNKRNIINDKWVIYEIDNKNSTIDLYMDPNYTLGFYCVDNIPPKIITIYSKEQ